MKLYDISEQYIHDQVRLKQHEARQRDARCCVPANLRSEFRTRPSF